MRGSSDDLELEWVYHGDWRSGSRGELQQSDTSHSTTGDGTTRSRLSYSKRKNTTSLSVYVLARPMIRSLPPTTHTRGLTIFRLVRLPLVESIGNLSFSTNAIFSSSCAG